MNYRTFFTNTGKITRIVSGADTDEHMRPEVGEDYIVGNCVGNYQYVHEGNVHDMPECPTPNHVFDYTVKNWIDPRSLDELKLAQWSQIKQARDLAEYAGFTWDDSVFDSNLVSQQRITGAVSLAQMDSDFVVEWVLANNTVRTLSASDMVGVGRALGAHVAAQFSKAQGLRTQIDVSTTVAEVIAIGW